MITYVKVKPAAGGKSSPIFMGDDASSEKIGDLSSGTILKLLDSGGGFSQVSLANATAGPALGGSAMTGFIAAYPHATMYKDKRRQNEIGKVQNGAICKIIDDTGPMFLVSAYTSAATKEGYVESKYIFRDMTDEDYDTNPISYEAIITSDTITETTSQDTGGMQTFSLSEPTTTTGAITAGTSVTITGGSAGTYQISTGTDDGPTTFFWGAIMSIMAISAAFVSVVSNVVQAAISSADLQVVGQVPDMYDVPDTWTDDDPFSEFGTIEFAEYTPIENDEEFNAILTKYVYSIGAASKYSMDIDIQYANDIFPGAGRVHLDKTVANSSYLSLCPGTVNMFPNLLATEKDSLYESVLAMSTNGSLTSKITGDSGGMFSSKMYSFESALTTYANILNPMCRNCAIMLGIGDTDVLGSDGGKLKSFDYTYWAFRGEYKEGSNSDVSDTSIFRNFFGGVIKAASSFFDAAFSNQAYLNYYLNGAETEVSESITTDLTDSPLSSAMDGLSDIGSKINYFTGSGFNTFKDDAETAVEAILGGSDIASGMMNLGMNILSGARMILPKMVSGCQYGRSISFNLKFISPFGDKLSIFYRCIFPTLSLLAMSLPVQVSDNMYTYPFLVKGGQIGTVAVDVGVISSLNIKRGGADNTSWTVDKLSTEWEIDIELTPLVDDLMVTSSKNPFLFIKNESLLDYLSNMCGFDAMAYNIKTKFQIVTNGFQNVGYDILRSFQNKASDVGYNKIGKWM